MLSSSLDETIIKPIAKAPLLHTSTFVKCLQFIPTIGAAGWGRFASIFFLENGITASQLSIITCVQASAKFIGYPTFGVLADFFGSAKSLLLFSVFFSNAVLFLFYFESTKTLIFSNFYLLLLVRGSRSYVNSMWSLVDAVTMKFIVDKKSYGKYRLFCSLSWGFGTLLAGKLIDIYGIQCVFLYGLFWSSITFSLIYFAMPSNTEHGHQHTYQSLPTTETTENGETDGNKETKIHKNDFCQICKLLISLRKDQQFIFCCILMLIYWNAMFIIERVIFIQMDQEFGATKTMMGIATLCTTIAEVPFFYYSKYFMKRFSLNQIFALCHIVLMIRLCSYTLCKDVSMVWIIYVIEVLHGINFGLGFTVCRVYLYQIGDNYSMNNELGINVRASIQSLKGLIILVSMFIGGLIWLPMYDRYSAATVYYNGSLTLIPSIFVLCFQRSSDKLFNTAK